jgi:anti-sigma regulatory factor (Ser/Thr protein kinase)
MNLSRFRLSAFYIRVLTSPVTLALLITLAGIPVINNWLPRYRAEITTSGLLEKIGGVCDYYDLNGDGNGEQILFFINTQGKPAYKVTDPSGKIVDQQEFPGDAFPKHVFEFFDDLDQDQYPELMVFYLRGDSLYLNISGYHKDFLRTNLIDTLVAIVKNPDGKKDFNIYQAPSADLDGDSVHEFIFSVMAGFPLAPRNHFAYFIKTGKLLTSSFTGACEAITYIDNSESSDKKVLITSAYAPGNMHDTLIEGRNDQAVWFEVLDTGFKPVFPPVKYNGEYCNLTCKPVFLGDSLRIALLYQHKGKPMLNASLELYTVDGKKLAENNFKKDSMPMGYDFLPTGESNTILLIDRNGNLSFYNERLELIRLKQSKLRGIHSKRWLDLDNDGTQEMVFFYSDFQRLGICKENFDHLVTVDIPHEDSYTRLALKMNRGKSSEIFLQFQQKYFLVAYGKNPAIYYRYVAYPGLFAAILGFALLIQFFQQIRLREKYQKERQLAALQLKLVKKQVDPHFLFNVITTLSYNLLNKESEEAYTGISRLAKFMRSAVEWGDKLARPLKEELEIVRTYLELYQKQHPGKFEFVIETEGSVDQQQLVPVMILLNFVENSIKHGISSREGVGRVTLRVFSEMKATFIEIEDNGIGRQAAKEAGTSGTGKGLGLMQQYVELLNRVNEGKVGYTITDLKDEVGQPAGTLVRVSIPSNIKLIAD